MSSDPTTLNLGETVQILTLLVLKNKGIITFRFLGGTFN